MEVISNEGGERVTRVVYSVAILNESGQPKVRVDVPVLVTQTDAQAAGLSEDFQWTSVEPAEPGCGDSPLGLSWALIHEVCKHAGDGVAAAQAAGRLLSTMEMRLGDE
jgi:hypothetical protein